MRTYLLCFFALFLSACAQKKEGVILVFKENLENPLLPLQKTLTIVDDKMKMDLELPQGNLTFYYQLGSSEFVVVVHPLQMILRSSSFSKEMMQKLSKNLPLNQKLGAMEKVQYRKVAHVEKAKEKVLNYTCELYEGLVKEERSQESCLTSYKELGLHDREWQTFTQFQKVLEGLFPIGQDTLEGIRSKHYLVQKGERLLSSELIQVERQSFTEEVFTRPQGYKKL